MGIKLWHDDTRPAPEGWVWAQNNHDAIELLKTGKVIECSLDHDMGASPGQIYAAGSDPNNGTELVKWMVAHPECVPEKITIHSWNIPAGRRMAESLANAGFSVLIEPYRPQDIHIFGPQ